MGYIPCYKMCQDVLEVFFNAVWLRNGWAVNPSARQLRLASRKLLIHAGKNMLISKSANCEVQDETTISTLSSASIQSVWQQDTVEPFDSSSGADSGAALEAERLPSHSCKPHPCWTCRAVIAYISGFIGHALQKVIKCRVCIAALLHSEEDKCPNTH